MLKSSSVILGIVWKEEESSGDAFSLEILSASASLRSFFYNLYSPTHSSAVCLSFFV